MLKIHITPFIMLLILTLYGCAHEDVQISSVEDIFNEANNLAKEDKIEKAAEKYMEVRTYYPGHDLAKMALLSTSNLYFDDEDYIRALSSYEEFRLLYPTDKQSDFCLFRIGMCHFNQMSTYDRDQTETVKTIQIFNKFLRAYPDSAYAKDANERLMDAKTLLANHYISIGKFYLKKGNLKSACDRFQHIKRQYPDVILEDNLEELIEKSCGLL